jgi:hypothetical protein
MTYAVGVFSCDNPSPSSGTAVLFLYYGFVFALAECKNKNIVSASTMLPQAESSGDAGQRQLASGLPMDSDNIRK